MNKIKVTVLVIIIFNLIFVSFAETILDMKTCENLAVENSFDAKSVKMDLIKKDIEKNQAIEGIKDIRKKESTVRFSLLFNIKFPEKHGMPKEIKLIMKVPTIENDMKILREKYKYEIRKTKNELQLLYLDILLNEYEIKNYKLQLDELTNSIEINEFRAATGLGDPEDLKYLEKSYEDIEKEYRKSTLNLENKKENLSSMIDMNVKVNYIFDDKDLKLAKLDRDNLSDMVDYALARDFSLFKEKSNTELAIRNVNEISSIYKAQFASKVKVLDSELRKEKIDIDTFYEKYKQALENIDSPWRRYYKIHLLFFTIRIPYRWFQGEYDGLRYFEDEKYALFLAVVDREKQVEKEKNARERFVQSVRNNFNNLKNSEIAYESAKTALAKEQESYDKKVEMNKIGRLSLQELDKAKKDFINSQNNVYSLLIDYNKSLSTFNFQVSGYLDHLFQSEGVDDFDIVSALSTKRDSDSMYTWYVKNSINDYKFTFGLDLGENSEYTHYELFTNENYKIGNKTEVTSEISHLPIAFENASSFYVKLYKDDELLAIGKFTGSDYSGSLAIDSVESNIYKVGTFIGRYDLIENKVFSQLNLKLNEDIKCDSYRLIKEDEKLSGDLLLSDNFRTVNLMKNNLDDIEIELLTDGKVVYHVRLSDGNIIISK